MDSACIACGDWRLYLMRYDYNPLSNTVRPVLLARRAPGLFYIKKMAQLYQLRKIHYHLFYQN